jgi:hypothetical protein
MDFIKFYKPSERRAYAKRGRILARQAARIELRRMGRRI